MSGLAPKQTLDEILGVVPPAPEELEGLLPLEQLGFQGSDGALERAGRNRNTRYGFVSRGGAFDTMSRRCSTP